MDLDKCVHAGEPEPAALDLLDRIGCDYIELSPSGTGLRGFGYGENIPGRRGRLDGVNVELYASKRYLTVTGHPIKSGPLVPLRGFSEVAHAIREATPQKRTEDDVGNPLYSSVLFCGVPPASTLPTQEGQRNRRLFELARWAKGARPEATREELRAIVQEWHRLAEPVIGTKDFSTSWAEFLTGWDKVRAPHGEVMGGILRNIDHAAPLPTGIEALGYGASAIHLVRVCRALQAHHGAEPFFISARQAGEVLALGHKEAALMLRALVADGVLVLVSKGAGKVASRYRFAWSISVQAPK
ncbi:hypothetical protein C7H73_08855 [Pulveribacter suum]|uniref:Primase C-terminal 1 domain-containing protein n=1 Tax=Pulveribacter suum TaxID=2116657 RepID=A0A2P1NLA0_9BURK|nr:hypothetical protein C7H73_08855 [Pulveribacter suum]